MVDKEYTKEENKEYEVSITDEKPNENEETTGQKEDLQSVLEMLVLAYKKNPFANEDVIASIPEMQKNYIVRS